MRAAERGVPGERQLTARREDAQPVVGVGVRRREHERRLGQVGPPCEAGHLVVGETQRVEDDGDGVAAVRGCGEDVDLGERALPHAAHRTQPTPRALDSDRGLRPMPVRMDL